MADQGAPVLIENVREDLALDFANTLTWRGCATPGETLHDLADLTAWLAKSARMQLSATAAASLAEALALREAIFSIFSAIATGQPADDSAVAALSRALEQAPARRRLAQVRGRFAWTIDETPGSTAGILAPVLWSAADLLLAADRRRIRRCANEQCLWLFIDTSKGGTRRWCDMRSCGNRAKAHRHYQRVRKG